MVAKLTPRNNAPGYGADMGSIASRAVAGGLKIGKDEFLPALNISAHRTDEKPDGEAWIDFNLISGIKTGRIETEVDGVITHEAGGLVNRFYTLNDSETEWETGFNSRPVSNELRYQVKHSNNLSFHKQILTAEQIANGDAYARPDAEGSYAVYIDGKRDGKYQTGKICHIYRPKLIDANGDEAWCDIDITPENNARIMTVTMPGTWLDNAAYPVILDPVLGYDTKGSLLADPGSLGWVFYSKGRLSDATGGELSTAYIWCADTGSGNAKVGLANANQSSPYLVTGKSLVGQSGDIAWANDSLQSAAISGTVAPNTWYRVGMAISSSNYRTYYDTIASFTVEYYIEGPYGSEIQDPVPATLTQANTAEISYWVEYAPASGQEVLMGGGLADDFTLMGGGQM